MKPANRYALYRLSTLESGRVKGTLIKDQYLAGVLDAEVRLIPTVIFGRDLVASVLDIIPNHVSRALDSTGVIRDILIKKVGQTNDAQPVAPSDTLYPSKDLTWIARYRIYDSAGNPMEPTTTIKWFSGLSTVEVFEQCVGRKPTSSDYAFVKAQGTNVFNLGPHLVKVITEDVQTALPVTKDSKYIQCKGHFGHKPRLDFNLPAISISYLPSTHTDPIKSSVCINCALTKNARWLANLLLMQDDFDSDDTIRNTLYGMALNKYPHEFSVFTLNHYLRELLNPCDFRYGLELTYNYFDGKNYYQYRHCPVYTPIGVFGSVAEYVIFALMERDISWGVDYLEVIDKQVKESIKVVNYGKGQTNYQALDWLDFDTRYVTGLYLHYLLSFTVNH